jgi:translation initiation factor 2 alpha subunit (eIF-2alpha)
MNIQCFYGRLRPIEEDYVVAEVTQIIEGSGFFVKLLEYGDCIGFVGIREISSTRFKKLKGILKVGLVEVMQVINIQGEHIDLTRKVEDLKKAEQVYQKYRRHKAIHEWFMYHAPNYTFDQKQGYLQTVLQSLSENIPNEYQSIHEDILKRFPIHPKSFIDKPSLEITQKEWIYKSLSDINHHLQKLEETYLVDITIINAKKNKFRITSRISRSE